MTRGQTKTKWQHQVTYETRHRVLDFFKTCGKKFISSKQLKQQLGLAPIQAGMIIRELCEPWTDSKHCAKKAYVIPESLRT